MLENVKTRDCPECGSVSTYCVAMREDDELGLRVVGKVVRHVCAICGFAEVVPGSARPESAPGGVRDEQ